MYVFPPKCVSKKIGTGFQCFQHKCLNNLFTRYKLSGPEKRTGTKGEAGNTGEWNVCVCECVYVCVSVCACLQL